MLKNNNITTGVAAPVTVHGLIEKKTRGEKIVALTAYDATFARLIDEGGADLILVGDSLGMVIQGYETTLPVTIDDMVYHTRAASRGVKRALLVADMPFMTYQASVERAMLNAARCIKEGGASAVKLEGGEEIVATVKKLVASGIPVMGHVGMQPQKVRAYGGFGIQGRDSTEAKQILRDAEAIADAGAFSIVLEKIPRALAARITKAIAIPTIGIASGVGCDGQILVSYDMFGLSDQYKFRFVRKYLNLADDVRTAVGKYRDDIQAESYPSDAESYE